MDKEQAVVHPEIVTEEIARSRWETFVRDLSRDCEGWRTWIEVMAPDIGDQPLLDGLTLQGVSVEREGTARGDILIELGEQDDFFIHQVERPRALRIAHIVPGGLMFMQIVSADGTVTLVRLQRSLELPPGKIQASSREAEGRGAPAWGRTSAQSKGWGRTVTRGRYEQRPLRYARRRAGDGLLLALVGVSALLFLTRGSRSRHGRREY